MISRVTRNLLEKGHLAQAMFGGMLSKDDPFGNI
jgi:hypothetical protein